jgi:hypothetical protein
MPPGAGRSGDKVFRVAAVGLLIAAVMTRLAAARLARRRDSPGLGAECRPEYEDVRLRHPDANHVRRFLTENRFELRREIPIPRS